MTIRTMAFVSGRGMWKRWIIFLGILFYVFILALRHTPTDEDVDEAPPDKREQQMLLLKIRSSYPAQKRDRIQREDYGKLGQTQHRIEAADYKRLDLGTGVLMRSGQTDKIILSDGGAPGGDKPHNNRALLAPSHEEPLAYIARNHTLAAVLNTKQPKSESHPLTYDSRDFQEQEQEQEQEGEVDTNKHARKELLNRIELQDDESFVESQSLLDKYAEYSLGRDANTAHVFHIVPDPLCLSRTPHPSCQQNQADPECHARMISCQPYLCSSQEEESAIPYLVVIIPSHPSNRYRREAIRDTWGAIARTALREEFQLRHKVAFVFLLGGSSSTDEQHQVAREHALYRDIVQYDVKDRYDLLSIKSVLMLDWIYYFCKSAKFFLKTDDDVFLDIPNTIKSLVNEPEKGLLIGSMHANSEVQRNGQWKVGKEIYPSPTYPPYCSGTAYVMSQDVARDLYMSHYSLRQALGSSRGTPVPMEDVYITGVLADHAKMACRDSKLFPNWTTGPSPRTLEAFLQGKVLGIHGLSASGIYGLQKVIKNCPNCAGNRTRLQRWFPLLTGAT